MNKNRKDAFSGTWFSIVVGMMFGIGIGMALDNWGVGIGLGIAMFLVFNTTGKKRKDK
ncbi:hypothetical protein MHZ92_10280 [Sporosarcina sp. ACRSL]|uniref:hypothetical protein n=1 Tax=Sporosarcina sp. ACRSL TaxID=2918215 RepID=UPI001EF7160B|nr:hypothetical protein [Sporosarcina sp. ACRSL]MCG7344523.1 hypothetical protein [Sporosarcina sp. ACRSL]